MKSLYEFGIEFNVLKDLVENDLEFNDETGEIIDNSVAISELYKELNMSFSDKLDNTMRYAGVLDGESNTLDKEIKRLQGKKKALDNKVDRLRNLVKDTMLYADISEFKSNLYSFKISKSESVEVEDVEFLASKYVRTKIEADKKTIKEDIKKGISVNGASIVVNKNLVVK